jgi:DNA-binding transcriptional ArsR family regulator
MSKYRISEIDQLMAEFCHATSSPRRSLLIRILSQGERTASELAAETGFSPANVSQHLKLLRDKRIVAVRRSGGRASYRLLQPKVLEAMELMRQAFLECMDTAPAGVGTNEVRAPGTPPPGRA